MNHLLKLGLLRPRLVLSLLLLVTLVAASRLPDLRFHISAETMMLEDDQNFQSYQRFLERFGSKDGVLLYFGDPQLLEPARLARIGQAVAAVEKLPEVSGTVSLFSLNEVRVDENGAVLSQPYFARPHETPEQRQDLLRAANANPLVAGELLSTDGKATVVAVHFHRERTQAGGDRQAIDAIQRIIAPLAGDLQQAFQIGSPVIRAAVTERIIADQQVILPASLGLLLLLLGIIFRRFNAALIPAATALMSVIWTLALMAQMGVAVNVMTSIIPALLLIIGSTEDIHLLSAYCSGLSAGQSPALALRRMVRQLGIAVLLTFLTTALGFLSIASNPIALLREFGWVAASGLTFNFVITSLLVPAWLKLSAPSGAGAGRTEPAPPGLFTRLALAIMRHLPRLRRLVYAAALIFSVAMLYGAGKVAVNNDPSDYFPADDPLMQQTRLLDRTLSGSHGFSILIDGEIEGTFLQVRYLEVLRQVQEHLRATGDFRKSASFADIMALVNTIMMEQDLADQQLPESDDMVREYMLFLKPEDVADYVTADLSEARIRVRHSIGSSQRLSNLVANLQAHLDASLPRGLHAVITGEEILTNHAADYMATGQAVSLLLVFLVIWGLVSLLFVNAKAGLIALLPNLFPILLLFGVMGYLEIPLDTSTAMVAAIALGICVDDTMHFMVRFHQQSRGQEPERALQETVREEATPIFSTSLALAAGFGVLGLSDFPPVVHFGLLSAMVMIAALLATFVITPLLLTSIRLVSLWDLLGLRLQRQVSQECRLFRAMKPWQIKKLILLSEVRDHAAGELIVQQESSGEELFVILEGETEVRLSTGDEERVLARMGPGQILGELALINGNRRTASVLALRETRLLVINWRSIERVRRLHPRISAQFFLNLATILGQRLVDSRDRQQPGATNTVAQAG